MAASVVALCPFSLNLELPGPLSAAADARGSGGRARPSPAILLLPAKKNSNDTHKTREERRIECCVPKNLSLELKLLVILEPFIGPV